MELQAKAYKFTKKGFSWRCPSVNLLNFLSKVFIEHLSLVIYSALQIKFSRLVLLLILGIIRLVQSQKFPEN